MTHIVFGFILDFEINFEIIRLKTHLQTYLQMGFLTYWFEPNAVKLNVRFT